jgi:hypothetical protein
MSGWRDKATKAHKLIALVIKEVPRQSPSWLELMVAKAKLEEAREELTDSLSILNALPSVREASKHITVRPAR